MSVKGKTIYVSLPNLWGLISGYRKWTLKFECGNCGSNPTVQHDEVKNWHKCPVCKEINILNRVSIND